MTIDCNSRSLPLPLSPDVTDDPPPIEERFDVVDSALPLRLLLLLLLPLPLFSPLITPLPLLLLLLLLVPLLPLLPLTLPIAANDNAGDGGTIGDMTSPGVIFPARRLPVGLAGVDSNAGLGNGDKSGAEPLRFRNVFVCSLLSVESSEIVGDRSSFIILGSELVAIIPCTLALLGGPEPGLLLPKGPGREDMSNVKKCRWFANKCPTSNSYTNNLPSRLCHGNSSSPSSSVSLSSVFEPRTPPLGISTCVCRFDCTDHRNTRRRRIATNNK